MKSIIIGLILAITLTSCGINDSNTTVDNAIIAVDGAIQVKYTSPDSVTTKILLPHEKRFDVASSGFVTATKRNKKITIMLMSGHTEVTRKSAIGSVRLQY